MNMSEEEQAKALKAWQSALRDYEGEFQSEFEFLAWNVHGQHLKIYCWPRYLKYMSMGVDISEGRGGSARGMSSPCNTADSAEAYTQKCIAFAELKRKEFEQLKLW